MKLLLPVRDVRVNQPFGVNYLGFYKELGYKGHNGIDFKTYRGCKINATHDGIVTCAGNSKTGGLTIEISSCSKGEGFKTVYCHLKEMNVKAGDKIKAGKVIGLADNTGTMTTGDHLHFGLKLIKDSITLNKDNGYNGAIDPAPYFTIGKDWDKSTSYHCYGRKRNWLLEYWLMFAPSNVQNRWVESGRWIHKQLKKVGFNPPLNNEQVNAIIYGGWDFESVINPSLYEAWGWIKKDDYLKGDRAFR